MTRRIALTALIASTAAASLANAQQRKQAEPKSRKLTRAEFDALASKPEQLLVIDVRRPDELIANGQFPVFLSIQAADLEKSLAYIPKDRTIVTASNHASRGLKAADLLDSKGFKVAGAIGAQDYESEGGKVLKITAPPADAKQAAAQK